MNLYTDTYEAELDTYRTAIQPPKGPKYDFGELILEQPWLLSSREWQFHFWHSQMTPSIDACTKHIHDVQQEACRRIPNHTTPLSRSAQTILHK